MPWSPRQRSRRSSISASRRQRSSATKVRVSFSCAVAAHSLLRYGDMRASATYLLPQLGSLGAATEVDRRSSDDLLSQHKQRCLLRPAADSRAESECRKCSAVQYSAVRPYRVPACTTERAPCAVSCGPAPLRLPVKKSHSANRPLPMPCLLLASTIEQPRHASARAL